MMSCRVLSMLVFAWAFGGRLPAQIAASQPQPTSPQPSPESHTVAMTVPNGIPLLYELDDTFARHLNKFAYRNGASTDLLRRVGAIYLRDIAVTPN